MKTKQLIKHTLSAKSFATKVLATAVLSGALLLVSSTGFAQIKAGVINPTVIDANSLLETESANGKKFIIHKSDGTMVIENTPDATTDDKFLKIDAAGNVKKLQQFIPTVKMTTQNSSGSFAMAAGATQRITLTPAANYVGLYDVANNQFTVPETGLYLVSMGGLFRSNLATSPAIHVQVMRNDGSGPEFVTSFVGTILGPAAFSTGNATIPFMLTAGDKVFMQFVTGVAQTVTYQKLNLMLMRVD